MEKYEESPGALLKAPPPEMGEGSPALCVGTTEGPDSLRHG